MDREFQQKSESKVNRNHWEFEYPASELAGAAKQQRDHRLERVRVWEEEKDKVIARIKETGLTVHEGIAAGMSNYTANTRGHGGAQVLVDRTMQVDLDECVAKIAHHREMGADYDSWVQVLDAQPADVYLKLKHGDWLYFFGR